MSKVNVKTYEIDPRFSEIILYELDTRFSRGTVTLAPHKDDLPMGTVLAKGADGTYAPFAAPAGSEEGQPASAAGKPAILIYDAPASDAPEEVAAITGYAIVNKNGLPIDASLLEDAVAALEAAGFTVKEDA